MKGANVSDENKPLKEGENGKAENQKTEIEGAKDTAGRSTSLPEPDARGPRS